MQNKIEGGAPPWWKFWASKDVGATHECIGTDTGVYGTPCGGGSYISDNDYDGKYADNFVEHP